MAYEIVWTDPATADLEAIVTFIAEKGQADAERVGLSILNHAEILASFPYIGPAYVSESGGRNREISYKSYRIFYRVMEDSKRVEILTVWHAARQDPDLPP